MITSFPSILNAALRFTLSPTLALSGAVIVKAELSDWGGFIVILTDLLTVAPSKEAVTNITAS